MDIPNCVTDTAREMIRLSHLAYDPPADIQAELANCKYGLDGWSLVWGPVFARDDVLQIDNLAFVAQKGSDETGELAVVIRGTTFTSPESWLDDLEFKLEPWPYTKVGASGVEVSEGLMHVFNQMTTETPSGDNHVGSTTLGDFLAAAPIRKIHVTGHSQGGATSTMMAAWIDWFLRRRGQAAGLVVSPYTFAGETAGNAAFADDLDARFPGTWRYWNEHDAVPRAWSDVNSIDTIYEPTLSTPDGIKLLVFGANLAVHDLGFTQPNGDGCKLPSTVRAESFTAEVEYQHSSATYIELMGDESADVATKSVGV